MSPELLNIAIYVPVVISVGIIYYNWPYLKIRVTEQQNDDMLAAANFLALLEEAEQEICIYNDGNKMDNGMYDNVDLIEEVKKKLKSNKGFVMLCSFNYNHKTEFKKEFEKEDYRERVTIIKRKIPSTLAHYKIIDEGKKAYLSWHNVGDHNRSVKLYDFSKTDPPWWFQKWQKDVKKEYIGDYLDDIRDQRKHCAQIGEGVRG